MSSLHISHTIGETLEKKLLTKKNANRLKVDERDGVSLKKTDEVTPFISINTPNDDVCDPMAVSLVLTEGDSFRADEKVQLMSLFRRYNFDLESFAGHVDAGDAYCQAIQAAINDAGKLQLYKEDGRPKARLELGNHYFHFNIQNAKGKKAFNW